MIDEQNESQQPVEAVQEGTQDTELVAATEAGTAESPVPEQPAQPVSEPDDEYNQRVQNWRALREKADRAKKLEQEQEELKRRLAQYETQKQPEEDNLSDDDLIEKRHLNNMAKKYEEKFNALEAKLAMSNLQAEMPDYYTVVTEDSAKMLEDADPDLARSILSNPDQASRARAAYKAIKMYGFAKTDKHKKQHEKAQTNAAKPRPLASVSPQQGESPLSRANAFAEGLTPELKAELLKEMQVCRRK